MTRREAQAHLEEVEAFLRDHPDPQTPDGCDQWESLDWERRRLRKRLGWS